jgi:UDPglucose--hexose-1-phosphate uridylyltransferase
MTDGVWEERWHPLREEWVIIAAHRQDRPWSGETVTTAAPAPPTYAPDCYLCPGNARISGARNPAYTGVFVFDNDHPCVGPLAPDTIGAPPAPYRNRPARGMARVVCYSPTHNTTLAEMSIEEIDLLFRVWQEEYRALGSRPEVSHVLVFENKGEVVGVSNPHPHCQIYATNFVFTYIERELRAGGRYLAETRRVLFQDVIAAERADGRRLLCECDGAIAFVPYFARYAYEVFVAPKATYPSLAAMPDAERRDLAAVLKRVLVQYDNLWQMSFPYVMALHQAPTMSDADARGFHFHIELHPPLRKPNLLKYLAGPEIGGGSFLSDTLPEAKAAELRATPETHYKHGVEVAGESPDEL